MKSIWNATANIPEFPALKNDIKTEVLIIGGGITGILTAYFLHQLNIPYILVEKNRICGGVTGNTTAKITFQHGLIYHKLFKTLGCEKTSMYLDANKLAFDKFAELCKNIDCDYELKNNFVYSVNSPKKLEDELSTLSKIGYEAEFFRQLSIPVETVGAVCFPHQAQFHPLKFLAAISAGLNIYENTFVRELIGNTAVTDYGKINAEKIVVATHFPFLNKHGLYFMKLHQHRSYVIALENAEVVNGMYVDDSKTGMSFRNYKNLLLLGGGSHRTGKKGGNWEELRSFASTVYPGAYEKYFWATQDCMSLDHMPYIGKYSKNTTNIYTASGFNKWGMTGAMLSAVLLSDIISGRSNDFASLFSPSRSILTPQLFANGFETTLNLLTPTPKRCPHLGCALKWNKAEQSWDCPCHGSRFDEKGKVLDNPANGDLKLSPKS